jgi:hypothetical protein
MTRTYVAFAIATTVAFGLSAKADAAVRKYDSSQTGFVARRAVPAPCLNSKSCFGNFSTRFESVWVERSPAGRVTESRARSERAGY